MNSRRVIGQYLDHIAQQLGTSLDFETGICSLSYGQGETLTIEVAEGSNVFILYTSVYSMHNNADLSLFKRMLSYSLLGRNTSGCCLGFDEESDQLLLSYQDEIARFDVNAFENRLLVFVEEANKVRADLKKKMLEQTSPEALTMPPTRQLDGFVRV